MERRLETAENGAEISPRPGLSPSFETQQVFVLPSYSLELQAGEKLSYIPVQQGKCSDTES